MGSYVRRCRTILIWEVRQGPELVAAVSNAGGIGVMGGVNYTCVTGCAKAVQPVIELKVCIVLPDQHSCVNVFRK